VVDDCSKDNTVGIARSYAERDARVKVYVNEKNLGDYPNRNQAARYAKGKYLKYLDSDDLIYPNGLQTFVHYMEANPDIAVGISSHVVQMERPYPLRFDPDRSLRYHFFEKGILDGGPSGTIIRRDVFFEVGQFSGKRMVGDFELWIKIAIHYPVMILPPSLIYWRGHSGQKFKAGNSEHVYFKLTLPTIIELVNSAGTVLTKQEQAKIINYHRQLSAKQLLLLAIREKSPLSAIKLFAYLDLKFADLYTAIVLRPTLKNR